MCLTIERTHINIPHMTKDHDTRYKKLFSNPVLVKELFLSFVKESWVKKIDFSKLERLDKSFVTDDFKEKESDLIYKARHGKSDVYIYLLIEFQSTVDRFMAIRMLRYITEFYEYLIKSKKPVNLPAVFPLMLYNGSRRWTAPVNSKEIIEKRIPEKYIPDFNYYKIDESEFSKEALKRIKNIVSAIFYIENSDPEELKKEIDIVIEMIRQEKPDEVKLFLNWINNFFKGIDNKIEISDKIDTINNIVEVKEMFAEALKRKEKEWFKQGMVEGKIEGKIEGKVEGKKQGMKIAASKMLKEGIDITQISRITGLSIEDIRKLKAKS